VKVELLNHFGDDLMVVNAARVSYGKSKAELDEKDAKLIKFLAEKGHTAPFRHPQLQFRVRCSITVERQIFKHVVGITTNSISGRYVDFSDSYDIPTILRKQSKNSKQGSDGELDRPDLIEKMNKLVQGCAFLYSELCEAGAAKEQARMILPQCLETQFIWTGSLLAFLHMCDLRIKPDAQAETRIVVSDMLTEVKNITGSPFKHSLAAFGYENSEKPVDIS
jgi:thymidylate synthase (FAD)